MKKDVRDEKNDDSIGSWCCGVVADILDEEFVRISRG
jgi:hypothetical protein